jgi:DNA-binding transcriptional LysR family regulator
VALSDMVSDQVRDGRLGPVLDTFTLPPQPVHLVDPQARWVAPKIRAFIDFAAPRLTTVLDQLARSCAHDAALAGRAEGSGRTA